MCPRFNYWSGLFTSKPFKLGCFLLCFLLRATASVHAQTVTNVDFVVVGSAYYLGDNPVVYDTIPTGCLLFWTVKPENDDRGVIYRSESGHIAFVQNGRLVLASSDGSPMSWLLNYGLAKNFNDAHGNSYTIRLPSVLVKRKYDTISMSVLVGEASSAFIGDYVDPRSKWAHVIGAVGSYGVMPVGGGVCRALYFYLDPNSSTGWSTSLFELDQNERFALRWAWRSGSYNMSLDAFRSHLNSGWWLNSRFIVDSTGITAIDVDGSGMGGGVSGPVAPENGGISTSIPGDILSPPVTPLGENGKWVYDPEKRVWQWQGDVADNADQINPYDNSVMPSNTLSTSGRWATESTLRKVLQTMEGFLKQQGITSEQFQAMIDSGVVSIVDGMVQYWEGKHIPQAIASVGDRVDQAAQSVGAQAGSAANQVSSSIAAASDQIRRKMNDDYSGLSGHIAANSSHVNNLRRAVNSGVDSIVDAINNIEAPSIDIDVPSTDGQTIENYDAPVGDVGSLGSGLFGLVSNSSIIDNFPGVTFSPVREFPDWSVGVFDWVVPMSYFSYSKNPEVSNLIHGVRKFLEWLCVVSLFVVSVRMIGGD